MVRHQAICQYGQPEPDVLFLQEINIHYSVGFLEKNIHGSNVPLDNVVRASGTTILFIRAMFGTIPGLMNYLTK